MTSKGATRSSDACSASSTRKKRPKSRMMTDPRPSTPSPLGGGVFILAGLTGSTENGRLVRRPFHRPGGTMERKDHPNLLGAAILAAVIGMLLLVLSLHAKLTGGTADTNGVLMGAALLVIAGLA